MIDTYTYNIITARVQQYRPVQRYTVYSFENVWKNEKKKTGPRWRWYTETAAATTSYRNRWRQEHDVSLAPASECSVIVRACVRACARTTTSAVGVFLSVARRGRVCGCLARSFADTRVTRTRRDSRVLDECAGSRASVYTTVPSISSFFKNKHASTQPVRKSIVLLLSFHVSSGAFFLLSSRRHIIIMFQMLLNYCR